MNPQENLVAAFARQEVAWIPWIPYIGGVNTPFFTPEGIKRRQDMVEIGCFLQDELGCDILIDGRTVRVSYPNSQVSTTRTGDIILDHYQVDGREMTRVHRIFAYGDQTTSAIADYPVKTRADLQTLRRLFEDQQVQLEPQDFDQKTERLSCRGVVYTNGPRTPLMMLLIDYMGLESFLTALTDYRQELEDLMNTIHQANLAVYRVLIQSSARVVGTFDDFDTALINPMLFQRYVQPCLSEYTAIIQGAEKYHMVHSCGHVRHFLAGCLQIGYDAHNYLTPPPTGNTTHAQARQVWGEQLTMMAAVDPVQLETRSPDEVARLVEQILVDFGTTRAAMVMTSSKPAVPEENLRAVARVLKHS